MLVAPKGDVVVTATRDAPAQAPRSTCPPREATGVHRRYVGTGGFCPSPMRGFCVPFSQVSMLADPLDRGNKPIIKAAVLADLLA